MLAESAVDFGFDGGWFGRFILPGFSLGGGEAEAGIVLVTPEGVAEDFERLVDVGHFLVGIGGGVDVWVVLARQLVICLADLFGVGVAGYAQNCVEGGHGDFLLWGFELSCAWWTGPNFGQNESGHGPSYAVKTMSIEMPGTPAQGKYQGPGWAEWLLGFACTILAATQLLSILRDPAPQTALSYYYQEPGVRAFHVAGLVIDFLIVLVVTVWIFAWKKAEIWQVLLMALCLTGFVLSWTELYRAIAPDPFRVYLLEGLPFGPINNKGLLGASVFVGFFAMKLPLGSIGQFAKVILRLILWVAIFGVQWMLFEKVMVRFQ